MKLLRLIAHCLMCIACWMFMLIVLEMNAWVSAVAIWPIGVISANYWNPEFHDTKEEEVEDS